MILKSLSRKSAHAAGSVVSYICRYIFRDQELTDRKLERSEANHLTQQFENGKVLFDYETNCIECKSADFVDMQMDRAIRIAKRNFLVRSLAKSEGIKGLDLKDTKFYINADYLIARHSSIERFYKLTYPRRPTQVVLPKKDATAPFIIRHNIRSRTLKGIIREFDRNESYRLYHRKDNVKVFHTILSFSNKDRDNVTEPLLNDIAKKFISLRGNNNLYCGTVHYDKDHVHLHIAISGTQLNGRSSRVSKQKFHSIKLALDTYQREKYPNELSHSLPEHGKGKRLTKEAIISNVKAKRQTNKETLLACVERAYQTATSKDDFLSLLTQSGHTPYFRSGRLQGIQFRGQTKFRFSRLGFDEKRLNDLDFKKGLQQLHDLRKGILRENNRPFQEMKKSSDKPLFNSNGKKVLEELKHIRKNENSRDREIEEQGRSLNYQRSDLIDLGERGLPRQVAFPHGEMQSCEDEMTMS